MAHRGEEDYIKCIYAMSVNQNNSETNRISNKQLCEYFSHSIQSVNEMIKRLMKKGLVDYLPYKGSALTAEGESVAEKLLRNHRIWEVFLVEKCGYALDEVHEEAERLEHVTSDRLADRLEALLSNPRVCPHGKPIPK